MSSEQIITAFRDVLSMIDGRKLANAKLPPPDRQRLYRAFRLRKCELSDLEYLMRRTRPDLIDKRSGRVKHTVAVALLDAGLIKTVTVGFTRTTVVVFR